MAIFLLCSRGLSFQHISLSVFQDIDVLVCGDGDMSFSRLISTSSSCKSVVATTWDTKEKLLTAFEAANENVEAITERSNSRVEYTIDATNLPFFKEFDVVLWNFPHIIGTFFNYERLAE